MVKKILLIILLGSLAVASDLMIDSVYEFEKPLGIKAPRSIAIDPSRGVIVSDEATHRIFVMKFGDKNWRILSGSKDHGDRDSTQGAGRFAMPQGLSVAKNGDIFVADSANSKIKKIDKTDSVITVIGSGSNGNIQSDPKSTQLNEPAFALALANGDLLIADTYNHQILKFANGQVARFAGEKMGFKDGTLDEASFAAPTAMCEGENGDIFVADSFNHAVRKISASGVVSTVAGKANAGFADGESALFSFPMGVACASSGELFVADTKNSAIRKITKRGEVLTVAGSDRNIVTKLKEPTAVAVDNQGRIFVLESRKVIILKEKPE